jgi:Protein of unknown function (DUF1573)
MYRFASLFFLLLSITLLASCEKEADPVSTDINKEGLTFKAMTIDYVATAAAADLVSKNGVQQLKKGADGLRTFQYTNTGTAPVVIKSAKGSCGCTVPKYQQEPIAPGASGTIEVRYDTQISGVFTKTVTVVTNGKPEQFTLSIKGVVE